LLEQLQHPIEEEQPARAQGKDVGVVQHRLRHGLAVHEQGVILAALTDTPVPAISHELRVAGRYARPLDNRIARQRRPDHHPFHSGREGHE
jgi:hypothetical protein